MDVFSKRLAELRKERGLTQAEFSNTLMEYAKMPVSSQSISVYENGREPGFELLRKMANFFGVTTDYLLGNSPFRTTEDEYLIKSAPEILLPPDESDSAPHEAAYQRLVYLINEYRKSGYRTSYFPYEVAGLIFFAAEWGNNPKKSGLENLLLWLSETSHCLSLALNRVMHGFDVDDAMGEMFSESAYELQGEDE